MTPQFFILSTNSLLWNGGPLSVTIILGNLCIANIFWSFFRTCFSSIDDNISTYGNLECLSITTSRYFLPGKGPLKSICTFSQGSLGISVIFSGSGFMSLLVAKQYLQFSIISLILWSICGNYIFSLTCAFVFSIP